MIKKLKELFLRLFSHKHSAHKLALSCAWGIYIAFSPFPGAHTLLILAISYVCSLYLPLVFAIASLNNPLTMIPLYWFDYLFGAWFTNFIPYNPHWEISLFEISAWFASYFSYNPHWEKSLFKIFGPGKICVWSFLIGGNVLGIIGAFVTYGLMRGSDYWLHGRTRE
jgi:uncharacterized protein (DUF2062 family)